MTACGGAPLATSTRGFAPPSVSQRSSTSICYLFENYCNLLLQFADLFDSLIVQPNKTNDRILKQDGAFILSGLATNKEDIVRSNDKFVIRKIHVEDKPRILKELENINITRATMFPDVDNVASFFKHKYYEVE